MGRPILPLNGLTAAYMALPTLFSTFAKHYLSKSHSDQKARDELGFDEAFALAKFFVEKSSQYTVEDIQVSSYLLSMSFPHCHLTQP